MQNEVRKIPSNFADCERYNDLQSNGKSLSSISVGVGSGAETPYANYKDMFKNIDL